MTEARHYATVSQATEPYVARVGDVIVARSAHAMLLEEVKDERQYPKVVYFPREDVAAECLQPTDHHTRCPIKGEASYLSIDAGGETVENSAWFYPDPLPDAAAVKNYVAFYPDKVTVEKA